MENNHKIIIRCSEDVMTLAYFAERAKRYEDKKWENEYDKIVCKQAYDIIPKIVDVKNGYVILEDNTIRCSDIVSSFIAAYDGCTESEMHADYNAMIQGY